MSSVKNPLEEKVSKLIKEVRSEIQAHGGDLELVKLENKKVVIKIFGACVGCPMARQTFNLGVENLIKEEIPEITEVEFIN